MAPIGWREQEERADGQTRRGGARALRHKKGVGRPMAYLRLSRNLTTIATTFNFYENSNYIQVPDSVIGVEKIFKFDTSAISGGMFSIKYQLFLNDLYYFSSVDLLSYAMTKTYLEDIDFLLTTDKQIRYNKRQDRLYLDIDWGAQSKDTFFVIDCYRALDPESFTQVYNDSFVKKYLTALIKRQWGQNLSKFSGTAMLGGVTLNGPELFSTALDEQQKLEEEIRLNYEEPPHFQQG